MLPLAHRSTVVPLAETQTFTRHTLGRSAHTDPMALGRVHEHRHFLLELGSSRTLEHARQEIYVNL